MGEEEGDLLDIFLSTATEELGVTNTIKVLKETNIFTSETNIDVDKTLGTHTNLPSKNIGTSLVHSGDTDSSDDEGNRNYQESKYNECGKEIKKLLINANDATPPSFSYENGRKQRIWKSKTNESALVNRSNAKSNTSIKSKIKNNSTTLGFQKEKSDGYMDPIFGIRIIKPLISSSVLQDRMSGRDAISFAQLSSYLRTKQKDKDWVIAGAIANKSVVKTSKNGNQFIIWTLTDLKTEIKTVTLFLFRSACTELWKTVVGTVIGVLNPSILDKKDGSKDEAVLSVDNPQRVMIFGTSKDLGTCKSLKKNGEKCTAIVNTTNCEYCIYHIKQEYQKCSLRSELQSNFVGRGLVALRNKVLGKNEVFYAGKSYTAIPAKKSKKLEQKDNNRLQSLFGNAKVNTVLQSKKKSAPKKKQNAARLDIAPAQRQRDLELLKRLAGPADLESKNNFTGTRSSELSLEDSKSTALTVISKLKQNNRNQTKVFNSQYDLSGDLIIDIENKNNFDVKLSEEVSLDNSKSKALDVIEKLRQRQNSVHKKIIDPNFESNGKNNELCTMFDDFFEDNLDYDDLDLKKSEGNSNKINKVETNCNMGQLLVNDNKLTKAKINENTEMKKFELIKTINSSSNTSSINNNDQKKTDFKLSSNLSSTAPTLRSFGGFLDLTKPRQSQRTDSAKLKAIKLIQEKGTIKKIDPNNTRGSGKKRTINETEKNISENEAKKTKLANSEFISERFKKMMAATSKHTDLLEARDDEEQEKYFQKQEMKEKMEEKMANTFKIACKAVKCLKCKYTSFSASDFCKREKHPLRVFDTMKRFFKCGNCGNRTVSLEIVPTVPCKNCGSGKWEKTGMMKEKIATVAQTLSIRGGEQKFVNSVATEANLNLMVPDD